jgi:GxxExxY protein
MEPSKQTDELAREVIDAAIEVHKHLGPGFLESVYEEALALELLRGISYLNARNLFPSFINKRMLVVTNWIF